MEPSWSSQGQGLYNSFSSEPPRSSARPPVSPSHPEVVNSNSDNRRTSLQSYQSSHGMSTFLSSPHAPISSSQNSGSSSLPSFPPHMYAPYHSSSNAGHPGSNTHALPHPMTSYTSISASSSGMPYPISSPMSLAEPLSNQSHRGSHLHGYHESPRMTGYSTSPGIHQLSPVSPITHLPHGGRGGSGLQHPGSTSTSSSSFPSVTRASATLPKTSKGLDRRSSSTSKSNGSWDEDQYGTMGEEMVDGKREDQPWGMPQDQYKALTPRDKKQVRNRIGARRFRAKRKDYVSTLESTVEARDEEIAALYKQIETQQSDIDDLRVRLGLPLVPRVKPPSGLGLTVGPTGSGGNWGPGTRSNETDKS